MLEKEPFQRFSDTLFYKTTSIPKSELLCCPVYKSWVRHFNLRVPFSTGVKILIAANLMPWKVLISGHCPGQDYRQWYMMMMKSCNGLGLHCASWKYKLIHAKFHNFSHKLSCHISSFFTGKINFTNRTLHLVKSTDIFYRLKTSQFWTHRFFIRIVIQQWAFWKWFKNRTGTLWPDRGFKRIIHSVTNIACKCGFHMHS